MSRPRASTPGSLLAARLRELLADEPTTREVAMFGGRAFLVHDRLAVSAGNGGDLLVRVDAARHDELLASPGTAPAEMGRGRSMGPGWITVSGDAVVRDDQLSQWLDIGLNSGPR